MPKRREELRFSPGWRSAASPDRLTYAFAMDYDIAGKPGGTNRALDEAHSGVCLSLSAQPGQVVGSGNGP